MMQNKPIIGRYARILLDDWFKRSFGQENSKRLLQLFLEALIPEHRILELPNSLNKGLKPGATVLENICYALHQMEHLTEQPAELKQEIFKLLFESAEIATFTPEERVKYQNDMTTERDRYNQLVFAEAKGREQGREEGREEGREGAIRKMVEQMRLRGMSEAEIEAIVRSAQD